MSDLVQEQLNYLSTQLADVRSQLVPLQRMEINATRKRLSSNLTLYVRSGGNDANDGLANTDARAFATIQAAIDALCTDYDHGLITPVIQVQPGTWTLPTTLFLRPHVGVPAIVLRGDTTTPSTTILQFDGTVVQCVSEFTLWRIEGFQLQRQSAGDRNLLVAERGSLVVGRMAFGNCGTNGNAILAQAGAQIYAGSQTFDILAGGFSMLRAIEHAMIRVTGSTFVFPGGGVNYTGATVTAAFHGSVYAGASNVFTNGAAVTGTRYVASELAHISTGGGGANYIPGNAAGAVSNGGIYT